jgi:NADPH-dependent 2,4-dienoyl-CoA reductase/sulfur reductase-like enzyme
MKRQHSDVLIVGAGPAGIAAATAAARAGCSVIVLDDQAAAGGQVWREGINPSSKQADSVKRRMVAEFRASGALLVAGRRVIDARTRGQLEAFVEQDSGAVEWYSYGHLILATGARERFLPFPGWTLPGVFGAGGLQALVKGGFSVAGKRIVVAGTGPLLLAVAAHLQADGAEIVALVEQAPLRKLMAFGAKLVRHPAKVVQGARYRAALAGVRYRTGCWPVRAEGEDFVTGVQLTDGKRTWTQPCDLIACGFHLVPNTELAMLLGCELSEGTVAVDRYQRTSVEAVFCAGEPTGIAGVEAALVQGEIAGLVAAGRRKSADALLKRREAERAFGERLAEAFALREELRSLADAETMVCRCEDVRFGQLQGRASWTDAKLQTRCGMGPCQGRVCGPAVEMIFGWRNTSVRPPLFPVPLSVLCAADGVDDCEEVIKEVL